MKDVLGELKDRVETEILRKSMKTVFSELKNEIASTEANKNSIKKIFEDLESLKELRLASSNVHKSSMKLVFAELRKNVENEVMKNLMKNVFDQLKIKVASTELHKSSMKKVFDEMKTKIESDNIKDSMKQVFKELEVKVSFKKTHKNLMKEILDEMQAKVTSTELKSTMSIVFDDLKRTVALNEVQKNSVKSVYEELLRLKDLKMTSSEVHKNSMVNVFDELQKKVQHEAVKKSMKQVFDELQVKVNSSNTHKISMKLVLEELKKQVKSESLKDSMSKVFDELRQNVALNKAHKNSLKTVLEELQEKVEKQVLKNSMKTVFKEMSDKVALSKFNQNYILNIHEEIENIEDLRVASTEIHKNSMKKVFDEINEKVENNCIKEIMKNVFEELEVKVENEVVKLSMKKVFKELETKINLCESVEALSEKEKLHKEEEQLEIKENELLSDKSNMNNMDKEIFEDEDENKQINDCKIEKEVLLTEKDLVIEDMETKGKEKECINDEKNEENMNKVFGKLDSRFQMFNGTNFDKKEPEVIKSQECNEKKTVNSFDDVLRNSMKSIFEEIEKRITLNEDSDSTYDDDIKDPSNKAYSQEEEDEILSESETDNVSIDKECLESVVLLKENPIIYEKTNCKEYGPKELTIESCKQLEHENPNVSPYNVDQNEVSVINNNLKFEDTNITTSSSGIELNTFKNLISKESAVEETNVTSDKQVDGLSSDNISENDLVLDSEFSETSVTNLDCEKSLNYEITKTMTYDLLKTLSVGEYTILNSNESETFEDNEKTLVQELLACEKTYSPDVDEMNITVPFETKILPTNSDDLLNSEQNDESDNFHTKLLSTDESKTFICDMPKTLLCEKSLAYGEPRTLTYTLPKIVYSEAIELLSQGEPEQLLCYDEKITECFTVDDVVSTENHEENHIAARTIDNHLENEVDNEVDQLTLVCSEKLELLSSNELEIEKKPTNVNNLEQVVKVENQESITVIKTEQSVCEENENLSDNSLMKTLESEKKISEYDDITVVDIAVNPTPTENTMKNSIRAALDELQRLISVELLKHSKLQALKELKVRISLSEETKSFTIKNPEVLSPRSQTPTFINENLNQVSENVETKVKETNGSNNEQHFEETKTCLETIAESTELYESNNENLNEKLCSIEETKQILCDVEQLYTEKDTASKKVELENTINNDYELQEFDSILGPVCATSASSIELNEEIKDLTFNDCMITVTDDLEHNFVSLESLSDFSSENNTDNYQENCSTPSEEDDITSNEEDFIKISMEDVVSLEDKDSLNLCIDSDCMIDTVLVDKIITSSNEANILSEKTVELSKNQNECESVEGFEDNFIDFNEPSPESVKDSGEPTFVSVLYPAPLSRSNTKEQIIVNDIKTAAPKVALIKHVPKPTPRKSLEAKKETNLKTDSKKRTNLKKLDPVKRAELLSSLQDIMSQAQQLRKRKLTNKEQKKIDESESDSFASSVSSDTGVEISDDGSVGESSRTRRESDPGPSRYQTNKKVARLDHKEVKLQQKKMSWVPNYVLKEKSYNFHKNRLNVQQPRKQNY